MNSLICEIYIYIEQTNKTPRKKTDLWFLEAGDWGRMHG